MLITTCPICGTGYTGHDLQRCELLGYQDSGLHGVVLELRDCCGTTISVPVRLGKYLSADAMARAEAEHDRQI